MKTATKVSLLAISLFAAQVTNTGFSDYVPNIPVVTWKNAAIATTVGVAGIATYLCDGVTKAKDGGKVALNWIDNNRKATAAIVVSLGAAIAAHKYNCFDCVTDYFTPDVAPEKTDVPVGNV